MHVTGPLGVLPKRLSAVRTTVGQPAQTGQSMPQEAGFTPLSSAQSQAAKARFGVALAKSHIVGAKDSFLITSDTDPELDKWQKVLWQKALNKGLDPFPVLFWKMDRHNLIQASARYGFPSRYRHWSWGQNYEDSLLPQKHGLSTLYELVVNTNPSHAYLLSENPTYAQQMVIAHVYGHSDFFKNNVEFSRTNRQMMERMGAHAATIERLRQENNISQDEMEKFIEKAHSVQDLIDFTAREPRELKIFEKRKPEPLPDDWGLADVSHLPESVRRLFNDPAEVSRRREEEMKRRQDEVDKIPQHPHADVLGFVIEQSTGLKDWQRQVLSIIRDENYYFVPQMRTKIMNEGWATFWHRRLMKEPDVWPVENSVDLIKLMAGGEAPQKYQINPYQVGRALFEDILTRWDKGQHGDAWEAMTDRKAKAEYDDKSMQGMAKVFEVRAQYNDLRFIKEFLTDDMVRKLKLYTWDVQEEDEDGNPASVVISSKQVEAIKHKIIEAYQNCGNPLITVVDGNYQKRGDLLLKHEYWYELKRDYAEQTLKNLFDLWGRPVHLDTKMEANGKKETPIRITIKQVTEVNSGGAKEVIRLTYHKLDPDTGTAATEGAEGRTWEVKKP